MKSFLAVSRIDGSIFHQAGCTTCHTIGPRSTVAKTQPESHSRSGQTTTPYAAIPHPLTLRLIRKQEIFGRRLEQFYASTSPLLSYYAASSSKPIKAVPRRHPHQHPHQLSFHDRPPHKLALKSITGSASDEIWPQLDSLVLSSFPGLKERTDIKRQHSLSDAMMADGLSAGVSQE